MRKEWIFASQADGAGGGGGLPPDFLNVFSFRLLVPSYLGDCIEVRRSSDNSTLNIGFSSGLLDTAALLSFVGAGDGFIKTWYNQTGADNVGQLTNASQPKIVISGTLQTLTGGQTAISFDTNGQRLNEITLGAFCPRVAAPSGDVSQIHYVRESTKTAGQMLLSSLNNRYNIVTQSGSTANPVTQNWARTGFADPDDNYYVLANGVRVDPFTNRGDAFTKITGSKIVSESNVGFETDQIVGISGFPTPTFSFIGKLAEIIVYNKAFDAFRDRAEILTIQNEINSYYAIY